MKKLIPLFSLLLFFSFAAFSQSSDRWERKADQIEDWAERFAVRVEHRAERTAENWEVRAEQFAENWEDWADDVADTFDRDWRIKVNGDRVFVGDVCQAYLGIHSGEISRAKAQRLGFENIYGSYITKVVKGSAAEEAGLRTFDYLYGIDEQRTSNNQDISDIMADFRPGEEVTLHFVRDGKNRSARATLGEYGSFNWSNEEEAFLGIRPHDYENDDDLDGVKVNIVSRSSAEEMGLENGDVIVAINDMEVLDWDDVCAAINTLEPGQKVDVTFERDGGKMTVKGDVQSHQDYQDRYDYGSSNDNNWNWGDENEMGEDDGAFIGIYTDRISEKKARKLGYDNPYGTVVTGVIKGTGAHQAGLMPFDYIYGVDEYRVGENQSLGGIMRKYEPGDEVTMHFYRKGKKQRANLTFGHHTDVEKEYKDKCQDPFLGIIQIHSGSSADGVRVKSVRNSTARKMGLEEGDIITAINDYPMLDWSDISTAIDMLSPGDQIEVRYVRDGEKRRASEKIMSYADAKNCENCDCDDNDNKRIHIEIDPDIDILIGGRDNRDRSREPRVEVEDVNIDMENLSSSDARDMRDRGVDMPIENSLKVNSLKLSPNPNIGMFELEFDLPEEGETLVRVYNPVGRTIYEYDLGRFSGDFTDYVDISQNGEGFYFLQVTQNGKAFTRKIVLSKD